MFEELPCFFSHYLMPASDEELPRIKPIPLKKRTQKQDKYKQQSEPEKPIIILREIDKPLLF